VRRYDKQDADGYDGQRPEDPYDETDDIPEHTEDVAKEASQELSEPEAHKDGADDERDPVLVGSPAHACARFIPMLLMLFTLPVLGTLPSPPTARTARCRHAWRSCRLLARCPEKE
jgi:hypothetical protein